MRQIWDIRNFACMQTVTLEEAETINDFAMVTKHKRLVSAGRKVGACLPPAARACS